MARLKRRRLVAAAAVAVLLAGCNATTGGVVLQVHPKQHYVQLVQIAAHGKRLGHKVRAYVCPKVAHRLHPGDWFEIRDYISGKYGVC